MSKLKNHFNQPATLAFYAFLVWMSLLALISVTNAFGQCEANLNHVKHLPPAYTTASAVAMAKAIVWNNIHYVTADAPTIERRGDEKLAFVAMDYATCLLQTYAYLTKEEMEMALGALGYHEAIEWCMNSSIYGKIAKPAPEKRPAGVCCGD